MYRPTEVREYIYGPDDVDELICQVDHAGDPVYYVQDAQQSVMALVADGPGGPEIEKSLGYEPYGAVLAAEPDPPAAQPFNRVGFHGLVFERLDGSSVASTPLRVVDPDGPGGEPERSAIGLYYARNRWYSPQLGRFLSRDPKDAAGPAIVAMHMNGSALSAALMPFSAAGHYGDGPNVYGFARSNPITIRDPMGLEWHHLYPQYLGGNSAGPGIWLDKDDHNTFHRTLSDLLGGGTHADQRSVWHLLGEPTRREYLVVASAAAGVDVNSMEFQSALDKAYRGGNHGTKVEWGPIAKGNHLRVPRARPQGDAAAVVGRIPGADRARALAKGAAVASGILSAAPLLALSLNNPAIRELARSTIRAQHAGQLSIWDEAFGLMDFHELTQDGFSAGWAWLEWSGGL